MQNPKKRLDFKGNNYPETLINTGLFLVSGIYRIFANIERQDGLLAEFDEELWYNIVESVTVNSESRVDINFRDGTVICVDEQVGAVRVSV